MCAYTYAYAHVHFYFIMCVYVFCVQWHVYCAHAHAYIHACSALARLLRGACHGSIQQAPSLFVHIFVRIVVVQLVCSMCVVLKCCVLLRAFDVALLLIVIGIVIVIAVLILIVMVLPSMLMSFLFPLLLSTGLRPFRRGRRKERRYGMLAGRKCRCGSSFVHVRVQILVQI